MSKNEIISKIYNDPSGFGSIKKTLDEAKQVDESITTDDVKDWFRKTVEEKPTKAHEFFCGSSSLSRIST